jgi:hypothetical protein
MNRLASCLILGLVTSPVVLSAQVEYPVKFVCGSRVLPAAPSVPSIRNAVKPGIYNTAINLLNPSRDSLRFRVTLAATDSAPVPGAVFPLLLTQNVMLPDRALELDCDDILRSAERLTRRIRFLKGFARIQSERELEVVAVYTGGPQAELATMDVERIAPLARTTDNPGPGPACRLSELTIVDNTGPAYLPNQMTRTKVRVGNLGNTTATNVEVELEDVTDTTANRFASAIIPVLNGGGTTAIVALDHNYLVPQASWGSMVAIVDPKGRISECDENNNKKQVVPE